MEALIKVFWDICRLRAAPQDVPASRGLFLVVVGLNLVYNLAFILTETGPFQAVLVVVANTAIMVGVVYLLLRVTGHAPRALQTLTAMQGTDFILGLYMLPLLLLMHWVSDSGQGPLGLMLILLYLWGVFITAHIFRHALSIHWVMAGLLSVGYFLLSVQVLNALLPASTGAL